MSGREFGNRVLTTTKQTRRLSFFFISFFSLFCHPGKSQHLVTTDRTVARSAVEHFNRRAIIGRDDRRDWYATNSPELRALGRSTAVLIDATSGRLIRTANGFRFSEKSKSYGESDGICSDVRFREQPAAGECSSYLIAPNVLVTAAHCIRNGCNHFHYVFDYHLKWSGEMPSSFSEDQVFACKRILSQNKDEDWAIIQLDRPTTGRSPFVLRKDGQPAVGTPVTILGYPRGIPLKIAGGASVLKPSGVGFADPSVFEANLDAFGGNSGSPVINSETFELEGIYVVGYGEFEDEELDPKTGKKCRRPRTIPNPGDATPGWVLRTSVFREQAKRAIQDASTR